MRRALILAVVALAGAGCGPAYREPPRTDGGGRGDPGTTVVGRVTPEGVVTADTLSGAVPDTVRVERETVVTGAIVQEPTAVTTSPDEEPAAGGPWRVQVFAARDQATALGVAREIEDGLGTTARIDREGGWYKVRVGGFADRADAEALRARLVERGYIEAFLVHVSRS